MTSSQDKSSQMTSRKYRSSSTGLNTFNIQFQISTNDKVELVPSNV